MSSSATMQQAKTEAAQPARRQQSKASAVQSELSDLRPQATAQRQLQDTANNSPQSHQLNTFQQMAQNSALATQLKAMSAMMNAPAVQRVEEDEPLQAKSATETAQRDVADAAEAPKPNNTGLPDNLKSGVESLSGMSMDHVKVHYNSAQPAQLNAHAYAQGSEIHVAPGQERHLPHEAWHVVQQAQGRVQPTMQMKAGVPVNDDAGLESEADVMGAKAQGLGSMQMRQNNNPGMSEFPVPQMVQRAPLMTLSKMQRSDSSVPIQRATEDLTLNGKTSTVATSMTATLDPANPPSYGQGSSEDSDLDAIMETLPTDPSHTATKKFVKGHLLNDNLGGMANKNNLYPITGQANKDHLDQVETKIKNYIDTGVGAPITYTVNVTNRSVVSKDMKPKKKGGVYATIDTPKATFDCTTTGGTSFANLTNEKITSEAETRS